MDEKVAEVANLTLRLREMSGKVMWHQSHRDEAAAELETQKSRAESAEARAKDVELKGVSLLIFKSLEWHYLGAFSVYDVAMDRQA